MTMMYNKLITICKSTKLISKVLVYLHILFVPTSSQYSVVLYVLSVVSSAITVSHCAFITLESILPQILSPITEIN